MNKIIHRDGTTSAKVFNNRSVEVDYGTLLPLLTKGLRVLDVGCGTGAISKGIAERVGSAGSVIGIDNTESFIQSGKVSYASVHNLQLIHADLFRYEPEEKFDLIVSARTLQWLSNPLEAIKKIKSWLKPKGTLSVLDYNHTTIKWTPEPPMNMQKFYAAFLTWRAEAGMNNHIAEDLSQYFTEAGFQDVQTFVADEVYKRDQPNFEQHLGIWSTVAGFKQVVDEGYIDEDTRLKAIYDYNQWIEAEAKEMIMRLNEVRGKA